MGTRMLLLGSALVGVGATVVVVALTGAGNDWLGGHLISCGGRYLRRPCAPGEIPWRMAWQGLVVALLGSAVLVGSTRGEPLRALLGAPHRSTTPFPTAAPPASVPPPARGTTSAAPADSAAQAAPRTASVGPPGADRRR